ncbi:hypothetical protein DF212_03770 [Lactobacillus johnsonii]|nr:hypothetical protein DF212_03770 [Lactobacillus johnsonii]
MTINDVTVTYLFNYAMKNNISFVATHLLHAGTPSCCDTSIRKMIINLNNDEEALPLEIAHEIGHILNGDKGKFYFCGDSCSSPIEVNAHKTGIKILASYYFEEVPKEEWNVHNFMYYYCIPSSYTDWIVSYLKSL